MFIYKILKNNWVVLCLLAVVVIAVFGQTIWFDYVQLDEGILLINNRFFISNIGNFFEAFKHDINFPSNVAPYYRPIFILSFMLNNLFGSSPLTYHLGGVLLHVVAACFVFWFFMVLGFRREISIASSLIFAVHPAVTPVVSWVPGRIEAILMILSLASLILFIKFLRTGDWRFMIGLFVSFSLALLTKEVAVALIPVMLFYYLMHRKEKGGELIVILSTGLAAILLSWYFVRESIISLARVVDLSFMQMVSILWSNSLSAILYIGKIILPFNLTVFPILENSSLVYGVSALIILVVFWVVSRIKILSLGFFGLLWFVVFLSPSLIGFYPTEKMVFFEHRLYLPFLGILIFFADGISKFKNLDTHKYRYLIPVSGLTILFGVLSFSYSGFYKDQFVFWQKAVADSPRAAQAHNGLATAYITSGKTEEALAEFRKALEINPKEKRIHLLLGLYHLEGGRYEEARLELEKEIEIDPAQFVVYHGLGRIYAQNRNLKKAEENFLKAVEINKEYVLARQDLVVLYFSQNKHKEAIVHLKELLKIQRPESVHFQIQKIIEIYAKEAALKYGF